MFRWGAALVVCVWMALGTAWAETQSGDPALRSGVLDNGMRYALLPNATPAGGLSLRLVVEVGSLEEDEGERGYAHFVEHMAFRATANFPEGQLEPAFARYGVTVGRDQNAFTSPERTLYQLDLSSGGADARALALTWLRDVVGAVRFEPGAVERERGVVQAERTTRHDPDADLVEAMGAFQGPELRTVRRSPIGDLAVVQTASPAGLQAFYARWYRPEHVVLVIVGAIDDPAGLEREIAAAFGDWRAQGAAPARPNLPGPDQARGLDAMVRADAKVSPGLSICRLAAARPLEGASLRERVLRRVWMQVLQNRLAKLDYAEPSILSANVSSDPDAREAFSTCVAASITGEAWRPALKALQREIARMDADPTEEELETALAELRGGLLGEIAQAATRDSSALADAVVYAAIHRRPFMEPRQAMRAFNQIVEGMEPEDVTRAWRDGWSGAGPFLTIAAPQVPTRAQALAAWAEKGPGGVQAAAERPQWAYGPLGAPGQVMQRQIMKDPDFVRLTYANGVVLNFRQTAFSKGKIEVRVRFGAGREGLGARPVQEGHLAAGAFVIGGLGRHSYSDLRAIYGEEPLKLWLEMNSSAYSFEASAFLDRLSQQLRLMAAYLSDPGFRVEMVDKLPTELANSYRAVRAAPVSVAFEEALRQRLPADLAGRELQAYLAGRTARDFDGLLRAAATAGPLEVTLVGDVDEAAAVDVVGKTLGALPARREPPADVYGGYQRFPAALPPQAVRVVHAGPPDKAAVVVVWPTFVAEPARRREEYAVELLSYVFDDALRGEVRERLGKSYGPTVSFSAPDRADEGYLVAAVETGAADLAAVERAVKAVAADLAAGQISEEMFASARTPLLASAAADMADNDWIALHLSGSARDPQQLRDLVEAPQVLADLSLDEIKRAAAQWLARPPLIVIAEPEPRT